MADTAVDTTATAEVTAKELKEKKEVEVEEKTDNGDAPANGTEEEAPPAEETDAQPVKRAAEEEEEEEEQEKVETKKQKTEENGDSKEAEVEA
uniref:Prothymosin alpha-A-like n=1 Tax=Acanthochromis polyacanthus TaxID=80966 RepID=A0A3Q1FGC4_9TELE